MVLVGCATSRQCFLLAASGQPALFRVAVLVPAHERPGSHAGIGPWQSPPVAAFRARLDRAVGDLAVDWIIAVVHDGAANLSSGHGSQVVRAGDAVLVVPGTVFRIDPHPIIAISVVAVDGDWLDPLVYWHRDVPVRRRGQHRWTLPAWREPPVHRGTVSSEALAMIASWLDELLTLMAPGTSAGVVQVQALTLNVLNVVATALGLTGPIVSWASPPLTRYRSVVELRPEVQTVAELLRADPARRWTLATLAEQTHLSASQLGRLFVAAFGRPPIAFLTVIRVQELAHRLRTTADPVPVCARAVGWANASFAARQFRKITGMTPSAYRRLPIAGRGFSRQR